MVLEIVVITLLVIEVSILLSGLLMLAYAPKLQPKVPKSDFKKNIPLVSVLIPAHKEGQHLKASLQSLLNQDYPNLEILVINDRSQDETPNIIEHFVGKFACCRGVNIKTVPDDWLGKPHALQQGLKQAKGEYCLLTDADVVHAPWVISATVAMCQAKQLDYCTVAPNITPATRVLSWFMPFLAYVLYLTLHPWRMNTRACYKATGIGAFIFVKTTLLQQTDALRAVALDPIDDLGIATAISLKSQNGAFVLGEEAITLDWYPSLLALAKGLEKNLYRQSNYSLIQFFSGLLALLIYILSPLLLLLVGSPVLTNIAIAILAIRFCSFLLQPRTSWLRKTVAYVLHPVSVLVFACIAIRAVVLAEKRQAISWGGVVHSLKKLRAFIK
jgi:glycosyltransferase involved in cell wall biosynthesis